MIALLARLRDADELAARRPVATARDRALLGWSDVTTQVARHCRNRLAAAAVRRQLPYADRDLLALLHQLADELQTLQRAGKQPPLADISDVADCLAQPAPRRLTGADLVAVARLAEDLDSLRGWLLQHRAQLAAWGEAAAQAPAFADLAAELRRCLDRDGLLVDAASPALWRLRRAVRDQEQQVRQSIQRAMAAAAQRGWTAAAEITVRGDRYCLPLNAADRRRVPGIVHDRSQTGQTVYVEPAATVQLANDLAERRLEMGAEETRLLAELNQRVDRAAPDLLAAAELHLQVDRVRAAALWSASRRARRPRLQPGGVLRLCQGRHPLLEEALAGGEVVPLDLELPDAARVLVISGPNAGGKSVALKTVGVLSLLAQCGWDVPAREDTCLPLVARLFVDLGDEQSIEASLSSFSAHLTQLQRFLTEADDRSLLLCDEIGGGTDPQEGTALALTVLDHLAARGALVVASTHYGLLKAAVAEHPAMINAAMDYDEVSLAPRFTLRIGAPGASHAFDIAARVGLDPALLAQARALVGEERYQLEQLLRELAQRARELAAQQQRWQRQLQELDRREAELAERAAELAQRVQDEQAAVRRRGEDLLREARRQLTAAVREVRRAGADQAAAHAARRQFHEVAQRLPAAPPRPAPPQLACGDRVDVPHLGLRGQVVELRGDKVGVLAEGLRVTVDRASVVPLEQNAAPSAASPPARHGDPAGPGGAVAWTWAHDDPGIPPELDLRGLRFEEAWNRLDKLLDRAVPVGLAHLTVVHGMGPGKLREQLLARLAADPRVAACHPGGERQTNFGATVIHLR